MRSVIVYESMYGNTRQIAEEIAAGLTGLGDLVVANVRDATPDVLADADLLVVGGPTHMHGMARPNSRRMAGEMAAKPGSGVALEARPEAPGLREWLDALGAAGRLHAVGAAFDTRMTGPALFTGQASKAIHRQLVKHGIPCIVAPESFLVTKENTLVEHERERARAWGTQLAEAVAKYPKARLHA